jgi:hypothetical protein
MVNPRRQSKATPLEKSWSTLAPPWGLAPLLAFRELTPEGLSGLAPAGSSALSAATDFDRFQVSGLSPYLGSTGALYRRFPPRSITGSREIPATDPSQPTSALKTSPPD